MLYYSTRDKERKHPFRLKDAAFAGLAPDGGLFMPEHYPQVDMAKVQALADESFASMASYLASLFFGEDTDASELDALVRDAFNFDVPLHKVADGLQTLLLFCGPTFAFKDFGGRFMGRMSGLLNRDGEPVIVLTATSGDTGSAVAHGFWNVDGVKVVVLYPSGKVSDLQEAQMTTLGGNIFPLRVDGCFDDCQRLVKEMFSDAGLRSRLRITSANSINILRWIPQSFYYFYGWCQWRKSAPFGQEAPDIVVPSGNYGNITAGMLAWRMGLPVRRFIAGANANDVVPQFLDGADYSPRPSVQTVANAMDVGAPSNFERMMYLFDGDPSAVRSFVSGRSYSDSEIEAAIAELYDKFGYVSDPHSAVGYLNYKCFDASGFWLSTAHAAKFGSVIERSIGLTPELPDAFKRIIGLPRVSLPLENSKDALESYLLTL